LLAPEPTATDRGKRVRHHVGRWWGVGTGRRSPGRENEVGEEGDEEDD